METFLALASAICYYKNGLCLLEIGLPIENITIYLFDTIRLYQNVYLKNVWKKEVVCITMIPWERKRNLPTGHSTGNTVR